MSSTPFTNPAQYGQISLLDDKNAELISNPNTYLYAPSGGVVIEELRPKCNNQIKIKHLVGEDIVFSVFCGVENIIVSNGDRIKSGEAIGSFGNDKIKYFIVDSNDKKIPISPYFQKKDKENIGNEKTTTTTTTKKPKDDSKDFPNPFLDILLSPFSVADSVTKSIKSDIKNIFNKKQKTESVKLKEEIDRIKKLIK